jgi:hypothetical protein
MAQVYIPPYVKADKHGPWMARKRVTDPKTQDVITRNYLRGKFAIPNDVAIVPTTHEITSCQEFDLIEVKGVPEYRFEDFPVRILWEANHRGMQARKSMTADYAEWCLCINGKIGMRRGNLSWAAEEGARIVRAYYQARADLPPEALALEDEWRA